MKTVQVNAAPRHVERDFMPDWMAVTVGNEFVVVNYAGEGLSTFTVDKTTNNPRVLAQAAAILWKGSVGLTNAEDKHTVTIQHRYAGIMDRLEMTETLDEKTVTLESTELVELEGHE